MSAPDITPNEREFAVETIRAAERLRATTADPHRLRTLNKIITELRLEYSLPEGAA